MRSQLGGFPFSWHPCVAHVPTVPLVPSLTLPCQLPVLKAAFSAAVGVVGAGFWRQQECGGTLEGNWTRVSFCSSVQECGCLERLEGKCWSGCCDVMFRSSLSAEAAEMR